MTVILQILTSPRPNSFSRRIARDVTARLVALHPRAEPPKPALPVAALPPECRTVVLEKWRSESLRPDARRTAAAVDPIGKRKKQRREAD